VEGGGGLAAVSAQVVVAVGASVVNIHAGVNAARDQTASTETSQQCDDDARDVGDDAGL